LTKGKADPDDRCCIGLHPTWDHVQLVLRLEGAEAAKHAAEESLRSACARARVLEAATETLQVRAAVRHTVLASVSGCLQSDVAAMAFPPQQFGSYKVSWRDALARSCKSWFDSASHVRRQSWAWLDKLQQKRLLCKSALMMPTAGSLTLRPVSKRQLRTPTSQQRRTPDMLMTCVPMQRQQRR